MAMSSNHVALHPIRTRASSSDQFRLCSGRLSSSSELSDPMTVESSCLDVDIYYKESSVSVGVPFLWESRPGTPKLNSRQYPLIPPLTPPPSFHSPSKPKHQSRRRRSPHSPSSSSAASSPLNDHHSTRFRVSTNEEECQSPVSTLCFGGARRRSRSSPGCSSAITRLFLRDFS